MEFRDVLLAAYRENPCQVLPNALWKTLAQLARFETAFGFAEGAVDWLAMWGEGLPSLWWSRERARSKVALTYFDHTDLVLAHQDFVSLFSASDFPLRKAYFRLSHDFQSVPDVSLPAEFCFSPVNVDSEAEKVAALIARCYDDMHPSPETVRVWAQHPVFDPDLWLWVLDDAGVPVGLGIAEADLTVSEGSLEWIQILPDYRGRGVGTALVCELLHRLRSRVVFATVSGEVDNVTCPELLYRRCGFRGDDVWWVLRKG